MNMYLIMVKYLQGGNEDNDPYREQCERSIVILIDVILYRERVRLFFVCCIWVHDKWSITTADSHNNEMQWNELEIG